MGVKMKFLNKSILALVLFGSFTAAQAGIYSDLKEKYNNISNRFDYALEHGEFVKKYGLDKKVIGDFPYNMVLHTAPFRRNAQKRKYWETIEYDYHWHFEVLPILTRVAGFEWGSGFYINPLPPEDACKSIKEAKAG